MENPKSFKVRKIGEVFLQLYDKLGGDAPVRMMQGAVCKDSENLCGTPHCHAGWYLHAVSAEINRGTIFTQGSSKMAEDLGFYSENELRRWADVNDEIWGNRFGDAMFCGFEAFGVNKYYELDLKIIGEHWIRVADRLEELEND